MLRDKRETFYITYLKDLFMDKIFERQQYILTTINVILYLQQRFQLLITHHSA